MLLVLNYLLFYLYLSFPSNPPEATKKNSVNLNRFIEKLRELLDHHAPCFPLWFVGHFLLCVCVCVRARVLLLLLLLLLLLPGPTSLFLLPTPSASLTLVLQFGIAASWHRNRTAGDLALALSPVPDPYDPAPNHVHEQSDRKPRGWEPGHDDSAKRHRSE